MLTNINQRISELNISCVSERMQRTMHLSRKKKNVSSYQDKENQKQAHSSKHGVDVAAGLQSQSIKFEWTTWEARGARSRRNECRCGKRPKWGGALPMALYWQSFTNKNIKDLYGGYPTNKKEKSCVTMCNNV